MTITHITDEELTMQHQIDDLKREVLAHSISLENAEMVTCCKHPDAPHSYNRSASINEDRYVCMCEGWKPEFDYKREALAYSITCENLEAGYEMA